MTVTDTIADTKRAILSSSITWNLRTKTTIGPIVFTYPTATIYKLGLGVVAAGRRIVVGQVRLVSVGNNGN